MGNPTPLDVDDIDRELLRLLSENPRESYKNLAELLAEEGYEMTGEGIRYRVKRLLESTETFFMLSPEEHGMEIVRIGIKLVNEPDVTGRVYGDIFALNDVWLVSQGFGTYDLWAIATADGNPRIAELLSKIRSNDGVGEVSHFIETDRRTDIGAYLALGDDQ